MYVNRILKDVLVVHSISILSLNNIYLSYHKQIS